MAKKEPKLTPWFHSEEVNPVRPGVYIATVNRNQVFYRRWDGEQWYCGDYEITASVTSRARLPWNASVSPLHWRGLAEQPKGARRG